MPTPRLLPCTENADGPNFIRPLHSFPLRPAATRLQAELVSYADEQALFLNPCEDDPAAHLDFVVADTPTCSLVVPRGDAAQRERDATSIQVYGLNRLGLVQDRTRLLRRLEFLGDLTVELGVLIDELGTPAVAEALDGVTVATHGTCHPWPPAHPAGPDSC